MRNTTPPLDRQGMLAQPLCPQGEYLALQAAEALQLRISEGGPTDEALTTTNKWMFRLPIPA